MIVNIKDFGADESAVNNAEYIQKAIDSISAGTVVVPEGVFVSSTLYLKSDVSLHLTEGACLKVIEDESMHHDN